MDQERQVNQVHELPEKKIKCWQWMNTNISKDENVYFTKIAVIILNFYILLSWLSMLVQFSGSSKEFLVIVDISCMARRHSLYSQPLGPMSTRLLLSYAERTSLATSPATWVGVHPPIFSSPRPTPTENHISNVINAVELSTSLANNAHKAYQYTKWKWSTKLYQIFQLQAFQ